MSVDVASMDVAYNILSAYFAPSRAPNLLAQCFFPLYAYWGILDHQPSRHATTNQHVFYLLGLKIVVMSLGAATCSGSLVIQAFLVLGNNEHF